MYNFLFYINKRNYCLRKYFDFLFLIGLHILKCLKYDVCCSKMSVCLNMTQVLWQVNLKN